MTTLYNYIKLGPNSLPSTGVPFMWSEMLRNIFFAKCQRFVPQDAIEGKGCNKKDSSAVSRKCITKKGDRVTIAPLGRIWERI